MLLARVKGHVVANQKVSSLTGATFYVVEPVDEHLKVLGDAFVAMDTVSSGVGDLVMYIDAREAPKALPNGYGPIDAAIVGIVDSAT